jgi:hypothetical protein
MRFQLIGSFRLAPEIFILQPPDRATSFGAPVSYYQYLAHHELLTVRYRGVRDIEKGVTETENLKPGGNQN